MLNRTSVAALLVAGLLAGPALARDYILAPIRPDKLVVVDAEAMAIETVITLEDAGPMPQLPVVSKDGSRAFVLMNGQESIAEVDLHSGKTLKRIDMSDGTTRVKGMFGMDLAPDGKTLVVYQSPVELHATEFKVQPTRIAFYDTETGALKSTAPAPRQITLLAYATDGSKIYGMGRNMFVFDATTGAVIEEKPIHGWQQDTHTQPDVLDVWSQFESSGVMATPFYAVRKDKDPTDPTAYQTGLLTLDLSTGDLSMRDAEATDIFYFSTAVSPDKTRLYGAYNFLSSFDLATPAPIKRVPLPHSYYSVNVSTDGRTVWLGGALGDLAAYDAETLERKGEVKMPGGASMSLASVRLFTRED